MTLLWHFLAILWQCHNLTTFTISQVVFYSKFEGEGYTPKSGLAKTKPNGQITTNPLDPITTLNTNGEKIISMTHSTQNFKIFAKIFNSRKLHIFIKNSEKSASSKCAFFILRKNAIINYAVWADGKMQFSVWDMNYAVFDEPILESTSQKKPNWAKSGFNRFISTVVHCDHD